VEARLIAVSTASRLLALPKLEQIEIATGDNPRQAARQAAGRLGMKSRSDIDLTRLLERLTSMFEKTPTGEMQELVRLYCDQRAISYEQCEKLTELARACVTRIADLATRLEAPILCSYQSCGKTYNQGRKGVCLAANIARPCVRSAPENLRPGRALSDEHLPIFPATSLDVLTLILWMCESFFGARCVTRAPRKALCDLDEFISVPR